MNGSRGVLYIAYGEQALAKLGASVASLRRHAPSIDISVVAAAEISGLNTIVRPDADAGARAYKTSMYSLSPYGQTLFLDADTIVLSSPDPGFKILNYVDVVLGQDLHRVFATNHWRHLNQDELATTAVELGTGQHMYFNDGVFLFNKSDRVEALMIAWHEEWQRWEEHDQMALLRAIHRSPIRIAAMRAPWNTRVRAEAQFVFHEHRTARREGAPQ